MRNHNLVSYETIVRAISGEPEVVEEKEGDIFYEGDSSYILEKHFSRGTSKPRDY
ncbi:MAG: hypothetical protein HFI29_03095 [Lachnospiraceae bacterium]|jgi:hypothetical protein|nr:hypothetical protein [Lachnospiraceae bacterium]